MLANINFTDRQKIEKERVEFSIRTSGERRWFTANFEIEDFGFPDNASVFVEVGYRGLKQVYDFNVVGNITPPASTEITDISNTEWFTFDLYVVDKSNGMILGKSEKIMVGTENTPTDRLPILAVNFVEMGNEFWRVVFDASDDGRPIVELNKELPNITSIAQGNIFFKCFVYTAAVRIILREYLRHTSFEEDADEWSWTNQWSDFLSKTLNIKNRPQPNDDTSFLSDEQEAWITECVDEFGKKYSLVEQFIKSQTTVTEY
jgi:hypothetical protein